MAKRVHASSSENKDNNLNNNENLSLKRFENAHEGLTDYFTIFSVNHDDRPFQHVNTIDEYAALYRFCRHPLSIKIACLIDATIKFLNETDPDFSCDRILNDKTALERLNLIADTINQFITESRDQCLSVKERETVLHAIEFCMNSINDRLAELKASNDRIYSLYHSHDNKLKALLNLTQESSLTPKQR